MKFTVTLSPASERRSASTGPPPTAPRRPASTTPPAAASLTFAPGETSKTIDVAVVGDTIERGERDAQGRSLQPDGRAGGEPRSTRRGTGRSSTRTRRRRSRSAIRARPRGRGRQLHRHARGDDPADGHRPLQHVRRNARPALTTPPASARSRLRPVRSRRRSLSTVLDDADGRAHRRTSLVTLGDAGRTARSRRARGVASIEASDRSSTHAPGTAAPAEHDSA